VIENTLSIAALVPGMLKENSKMSCFFTKYIHFAQTRILQTIFQKLWFCIPFIHSGFTYICIRYVTLSNSSKICCMAKAAKTFTTMDSHFARPNENFSLCNLLITEDVQSMDRKGMVVFYCVKCKQSFFGCNTFTLIGYSFFGKIMLLFYCNV
jgi:hypothetical protein